MPVIPGDSHQLLELARSAGLLTPEQAGSVEVLPQDTAADTARRLVERSLLTEYQAEEVLAGRAQRLLLAGRYRLEARLGSGATGTVYRAQDLTLSRSVAVKVLPPDRMADESTVARFQREAKALGRLAHPTIVQAYDAGRDGEQHYLVMECVEGVSLERLIEERGRVEPAQAADIAYQVCLGLAHAHAKGLVHRDLKPSNVMLTPQGRAKILDLGLARFLQDTVGDSTLTREGMGMGTPDYVAPEQFKDAHAADPRSDLYSLGCTLYHALAGEVPFPGTSLAAKLLAHEREQPAPVEQHAPGCPAGLALVVQRLMSKQPEDRFGSALEAAEALGVFISATSVAMPDVKATMTWNGSSLRLGRPPASRRRLALLGGGAVLLAALGGYALATLTGQDGPAAPGETPPAPAARAAEPAAAPPEVAADVLTVAQDGSGRYRTIGQALAEVRAGQTIRVTDAGTYSEAVRISQRSRHEGITLEATGGATLAWAKGATPWGLSVQAVPGVTVRGFAVRSEATGVAIEITGACAGTTLERLRVSGGSEVDGIGLRPTDPVPGQPPLVVRDCSLQSLRFGVYVLCQDEQSHVPAPGGGVRIHGNRIEGCTKGVMLQGEVHDVQVVGNLLYGGGDWGALEITNLLPGARDVLVANNTCFETRLGLRLWDDDVRGARVEVLANVMQGNVYAGAAFLESGGALAGTSRGGGDGRLVTARWRVARNWREVARPGATVTEAVRQGWIPPAPDDRDAAAAAFVSRDPDSPDFLRPAADSPLATGGVGAEGLPPWAGAVPPAGQEAWDWEQAWQARQGRVITVSADPQDGGRVRTLAEALAEVQPGGIVRVLDDATYPEPLRISQPSRHAGITLEAPRGATITSAKEQVPGVHQGVWIHGVPGVTLRGFKLRGQTMGPAVFASGPCPGTVLEDLDVAESASIDAITIENEHPAADSPICVVRRCIVRSARFGLRVGYANPDGMLGECGRTVLLDNRVENCLKGISLVGTLRDVHAVGNVVLGGGEMAALEVAALGAPSRDLLIANNTIFESQYGFRIWDDDVRGERVELRNNAFLGFPHGGEAYVVDSGGTASSARGPGDGRRVLQRWRVGKNARESKQATEASLYIRRGALPPAPTDWLEPEIAVLSRDRGSPDFLRPVPDSALAKEGVGAEGLPPWVGAVPPAGAAPWAWERAWEARQGAVLTVSQNASDGGRFRRVRAALDAAGPGAVVRLLDDAEYQETLTLDDPARHAGLTLEAERGAVLVDDSTTGTACVLINSVPGVTVRGLSFRSAGAGNAAVGVRGSCPGVRVADCRVEGRGGLAQIGGCDLAPDQDPVVIERCHVRGAMFAIAVYGHVVMHGVPPPVPCGGVVIRDNVLRNVGLGISVQGEVHDVLVAGNRVWGASMAALQVALLKPGARGITFANNTAGRANSAFRLWDGGVTGERIAVRDNVLLAEPGMAGVCFADSGGTVTELRGAGDGALVRARWSLERNRRLASDAALEATHGWVPLSATDRAEPAIEFLSTDPESADFLKPAADSPLATGGAGPADPAYPPWAGAVPPAGAAPWDWTAAFEALRARR